MSIELKVRKELIKVYKWARQDSEPPSCCIDQAFSQILALLPATLTKEEIKKLMPKEIEEEGSLYEQAIISYYKKIRNQALEDIATALEGKVSVGGREKLENTNQYLRKEINILRQEDRINVLMIKELRADNEKLKRSKK